MTYPPLPLCAACSRRDCENRGPDCNDTDICQCPCALATDLQELAEFARTLRSVPFPEEALRRG